MEIGVSNCISFNTQPPEGGWAAKQANQNDQQRFNTQPPEGGWFLYALGFRL